jgi:pilus assembly protein CpaC
VLGAVPGAAFAQAVVGDAPIAVSASEPPAAVPAAPPATTAGSDEKTAVPQILRPGTTTATTAPATDPAAVETAPLDPKMLEPVTNATVAKPAQDAKTAAPAPVPAPVLAPPVPAPPDPILPNAAAPTPVPPPDAIPAPVATAAPLSTPESKPFTVPLVLEPRRDSSGLLPEKPTSFPPRRTTEDVVKHVTDLVEVTQEPEAEISVVINQTKLIETKRSLTRIVVANPSVADVELLTDQPNTKLLNLFGRAFGTTTITLWDDTNKPITFLVRVTLDSRDLESRIKQTFPGSMVHVRQVGPQVILEGQVPDSKTMSEILQLVQAEVRNSGGIRMMGGGMGSSPSMAGGAAGGAGMAGSTGAAGAGGAGMSGGGMATGGMGGGGMAGGMGGGMGGGIQFSIINRVHVPGARQVMLKVKIAELNRTAIRQLGVSWLDPKNNAILGSTVGGAAQINAAVTPATQSATTNARGMLPPIVSSFNAAATATNSGNLFGIFNAGQFSMFVNALRSNALAKVLAEPNLMTLDGQPARFLAGGLFPYPVPQSSSIPGGTAVVTVQFANFGAILSFLPHILANDVIRLDVEPVFSQLNFGAGTTINGGVVPAIDQRSARTVVELREGQTLAIAGLLQQTTNNTSVRIPGLGDLPIVGGLFSQNQAQTVETELVVMVTPEIVAPMEANEVPPSPGDRVFQPNDYEFFFLGRIEGKLGREFRATVYELDPFNVMKHIASENQWVVGPHGHAD